MPSKAKSRTLTDHDEIREWAEDRGARPSAVRATDTEESVGIIRLDFPGYSGANSLEEIGWDEWFERFDENNLALVVQDDMANGQKSNFNKLVSRENIEDYSQETSEKKGGASRSGSRKKTNARGQSTQAKRESGRSTAKKSAAARESGTHQAKQGEESSRKTGRKRAA